MSDFSGKFTESEKARAKKWYARIRQKPVCALCQENDWVLHKHVYGPNEFCGATKRNGTGVFPLFFLVCKNCGYSLSVNGLVSGVLKDNDDGDDDDDYIDI